VIHDPALCIAQSIAGFETNASAPSPAHLSQSRARRGQTLQGEHTVRPPRPWMIREPWAACAARRARPIEGEDELFGFLTTEAGAIVLKPGAPHLFAPAPPAGFRRC